MTLEEDIELMRGVLAQVTVASIAVALKQRKPIGPKLRHWAELFDSLDRKKRSLRGKKAE